MTISQLTTPTHGGAAIEIGKIKYTPNATFAGSDSFDYTIVDGNGGSATATVRIQVLHVNHQPISKDGSVSTNEDTSIVVKPEC